TPRSTLFPYTTLFRSRLLTVDHQRHIEDEAHRPGEYERRLATLTGGLALFHLGAPELSGDQRLGHHFLRHAGAFEPGAANRRGRSEEHTSELQSRENL